jgi:hypothetical protein
MRRLTILMTTFGIALQLTSPTEGAEPNACQLVNGDSAKQLLARPFKGTPAPLQVPRTDGIKESSCSYSADGGPFTLLGASLLEFESVDLAKAWMLRSSKPWGGNTGQLKQMAEPTIGEEGHCWAEHARTGCSARKGRIVLEISIRGSSTTNSEFRVTPELTARVREVIKNGIKRL